MSKKQRRVTPLLALAVPAFAVASILVLVVLSRRPGDVGLVEGKLLPCPSASNCVCSTDALGESAVAPLPLAGEDVRAAFARLVTTAAGMQGARAVTVEETYAHLVYTTSLLRFMDDLELLLDEDAGVAHVRSASRVGRSDLGANRARVAALRTLWSADAGGEDVPDGNGR